MHPGKWFFKCKRKPDWTIRKLKAQYCVRGGVHNILSPEPLKSYSPVVQWATVRLMFILQCIIGFQIQSIEFTNYFDQPDITSEAIIFQCDVVIILKKSLYSQSKSEQLWYKKL